MGATRLGFKDSLMQFLDSHRPSTKSKLFLYSPTLLLAVPYNSLLHHILLPFCKFKSCPPLKN